MWRAAPHLAAVCLQERVEVAMKHYTLLIALVVLGGGAYWLWGALAGVLIEPMPFADCIERYDSRTGTLFYCDPPYWGCEDDYGKGLFSAADFERLRGLLEGLQGRFILSINDTPETRAIFAGMQMEEVGLNYRVSGQATPARELIISGP